MKKLILKKLIPNPEYEEAQFEGVALNADGERLSKKTSAMLFGRILPPRFILSDDKTLLEIPSHIKEP